MFRKIFPSFGVIGLFAFSALAGQPGELASFTVTKYHNTGEPLVDGLVPTTTINLAGDTVTTLSAGGGQVRKQIVGTGADAIVSSRTYDATGNLLSVRDATGAGTDYAYDELNRRLSETDAQIAGKVRTHVYDAGNRLVSSVDALGVATTFAYDARDRKISESTPMSASETRVIRYGYDGRGNMTALTDGNGKVTTWGYDAAGRQVSKLYANGDRRSMAYDALGRLVKLTDENGHDTTSTYDLAGRLASKHFSADNTTDTFAYDNASRMVSVTKGRFGHTLTYQYDSAGRQTAETHPGGASLHLGYDPASRLSALALDAYAVSYAHDGRGLLSGVTHGDHATRYEYRANGQLRATVNYRLADPVADILRADRHYDAGARLLQVANTAANGDQAGVTHTLGLDDQRLTATEETGAKWDYGYDGLKQLVSAKKTDTDASVIPPLDQRYDYDTMGNRRTYDEQGKTVSYATNDANQYSGITESGIVPTVRNPSYDRNGNMLSDGVKNYTWDAENQLIAVQPAVPSEGLKKVTFSYDWRMRRIGKKVYAHTSGDWVLLTEHAYKYHEWNPIEELITSAPNTSTPTTTAKRYVWGNDLSGNLHGAGGVGGLLAMKVTGSNNSQPSTDSYFYAYDANGNVRALVKADTANPAASAVVERYAYDGFGRELQGSNLTPATSHLNTFRFSTKQLDAETGMNYYGYRFYAASTGRWINRDPIMFSNKKTSFYAEFHQSSISLIVKIQRHLESGGGLIYGFADNSPILNYDILGLLPDCPEHNVRQSSSGGYEYRTTTQAAPPKSNGCGAAGSSFTPPQGGWNWDFASPCNAHDVCYGTCGSDKVSCDRDFLSNMYNECTYLPWYERAVCNTQAEIYHQAVMRWGNAPFNVAQDMGCKWEGCCLKKK